jgi:hypothetical protein
MFNSMGFSGNAAVVQGEKCGHVKQVRVRGRCMKFLTILLMRWPKSAEKCIEENFIINMEHEYYIQYKLNR